MAAEVRSYEPALRWAYRTDADQVMATWTWSQWQLHKQFLDEFLLARPGGV